METTATIESATSKRSMAKSAITTCGTVILWCLAAIVMDRAIVTLFLIINGAPASTFEHSLVIRGIEGFILSILWTSHSMSMKEIKKVWWQEIAIGLSIAAGGFLAVLLLDGMVFQWTGQHPIVWFHSPVEHEPLWAVIAFGVVVGPWVEELFFRGFLWESIVQHHQSHLGKWSRSCGLLTATFCFAALHINWAISFQYQWPMLMAWLCCGGLSFSLYFWRKSLIVPICVHGCANAVMLTPWSFS